MVIAAIPETFRPLRRSEYDKLVELGVFEEERIELLDGVLVPMNPPGPRHSSAVDLFTLLLVRAVGDRARIRVQNPFAVSDISETEPDLVLAPLEDYVTSHPAEAYLVIEIAESSLAKDRGTKWRIYAERGVPEYWIVDVVSQRVEVHRHPTGGAFQSTRVYERHETLDILRFPDVRIRIADVLK